MTTKDDNSEKENTSSPKLESNIRKLIETQRTISALEIKPIITKKVLYPSKKNGTLQCIPVVGGTSLTEELANNLRAFAFGPTAVISYYFTDWIESSFAFNEESSKLSWALKVVNDYTKGLIMCVQAYVLKSLMFSRRRNRATNDINTILKPDKRTQEECFASAISDILWKAGDKQKVTLCLTHENENENLEFFRRDGITEKIRIFHFKKQDDLTFNIKKYLYQFVDDESGNTGGCALFLYSLILTRGFERLKSEMDEKDPSAVLENGSLNRSMAGLILTGKATPYFHNGIIFEGNENTMALPKTGIIIRSEIGLLAWNGTGSGNKISVGSRLKTPSYPIWVTMCNDNYGVLFNLNKDLMRDYHAENRFSMFYYSGHPSKKVATELTIDSREPKILDPFSGPPLELLIQTKWEDASVNWNGEEPYV